MCSCGGDERYIERNESAKRQKDPEGPSAPYGPLVHSGGKCAFSGNSSCCHLSPGVDICQTDPGARHASSSTSRCQGKHWATPKIMPPDERFDADPGAPLPSASAVRMPAVPATGWVRNSDLFRARALGLSRCQTLERLSKVGGSREGKASGKWMAQLCARQRLLGVAVANPAARIVQRFYSSRNLPYTAKKSVDTHGRPAVKAAFFYNALPPSVSRRSWTRALDPTNPSRSCRYVRCS